MRRSAKATSQRTTHYYIARAFGGLLFLLGAVVGSYNVWMTIRWTQGVAEKAGEDLPETRLAPVAAQPAE